MFGRSIKLFTLLGFEVKIDMSWLILALLIIWTLARGFFPFYVPDLTDRTYWIMGVFGALGLFVSIILHELSHSLVARRYGLAMKGITLFIFGGVAEMEDEPPSAKAEFMMASAGPVSSVLIAIVCWGAYRTGGGIGMSVPAIGVLQYLALINALLAGFNLLPAFPLDGGRVLRSVLWAAKKNLRWATRVCSEIGKGFGLALIVLGVLSVLVGNLIGGIWWFLIGMFIRNASNMSYRQLLIREALEGEEARDLMKEETAAVPAAMPVDRLVEDYFYKYHMKNFPVVEDDRLVGCINSQNLKDVPRSEWDRHTAGEIARECEIDTIVAPQEGAMHILQAMNKTNRKRMMVVEGDHLIGVVTLKDLIRHLSTKLNLEGNGRELEAMIDRDNGQSDD